MNLFYDKYLSIFPEILNSLNLNFFKVIIFLLLYYILACFAALFEGLSLLLFASIITNVNSIEDIIPSTQVFRDYMPFLQNKNLFFNLKILIFMFTVTLFLKIFINFTDGYFVAKLRQNLQSHIYNKYLISSWEDVGHIRVGEAIGTITSETLMLVKYTHSFMLIFFHLLYALILIILAFKTNFIITVYILLLFVPFIFLMKYLVFRQAILGEKLAIARNSFSGDVVDRLTGLFQIHVSKNKKHHYIQGLKKQIVYTITEIKIAGYLSIIQNFNILLPLTGIIILFFWLNFGNFMNGTVIPTTSIAGIGLLGLKATGQFNSLATSFGNLVRLIGGVEIVSKVLKIKLKYKKQLISEEIYKIKVKKINFGYKNLLFKNLSLNFIKNKINIIEGKSGSGKSTLAKLIVGLIYPINGEILYTTKNNIDKNSINNYPNFGYISQDIYLFNETIRNNLTHGLKINDSKIWKILKSIDADVFIKKMGGLDTIILEGGKNLSGGQIRRLGIARMIISNAKVIIFDEPTSGLDYKNKNSLLTLIKKLKKDFLLIIISHEKLNLPDNDINLINL